MISVIFRKFCRERKGNFAVIFAGLAMTLTVSVAAAVDINNKNNEYTKAQDRADAAVLAAAKYISDQRELAVKTRRKLPSQRQLNRGAMRQGNHELRDFLNRDVVVSHKPPTYYFTGDSVTVRLDFSTRAALMGMFNHKSLHNRVWSKAGVTRVVEERTNVDIALISDATGSMDDTLKGIQDNMKFFIRDLDATLKKSDVELGTVRIKFIFYRDYMIDNYKGWTSRKMKLKAGLEKHGAMYESRFYSLPRDANQMENYIDFFKANGGASLRESGFEAVWYAFATPGWRSGKDTARVAVLWTDAPPRKFGDFTEEGLEPNHWYFFRDPYWDKAIGRFFTNMDWHQRERYMVNRYYPKNAPKNLRQLKGIVEKFNAANKKNAPDVKTLTVNIINNCYNYKPCGDWESLSAWKGVEVRRTRGRVSSSQTYDKIVEQVADMVVGQANVGHKEVSLIQ